MGRKKTQKANTVRLDIKVRLLGKGGHRKKGVRKKQKGGDGGKDVGVYIKHGLKKRGGVRDRQSEQSSVLGGELQRPVNWGSLCFEGAKEKGKGMRKENEKGNKLPLC